MNTISIILVIGYVLMKISNKLSSRNIGPDEMAD
jgi:hypothetical protein